MVNSIINKFMAQYFCVSSFMVYDEENIYIRTWKKFCLTSNYYFWYLDVKFKISFTFLAIFYIEFDRITCNFLILACRKMLNIFERANSTSIRICFHLISSAHVFAFVSNRYYQDFSSFIFFPAILLAFIFLKCVDCFTIVSSV